MRDSQVCRHYRKINQISNYTQWCLLLQVWNIVINCIHPIFNGQQRLLQWWYEWQTEMAHSSLLDVVTRCKGRYSRQDDNMSYYLILCAWLLNVDVARCLSSCQQYTRFGKNGEILGMHRVVHNVGTFTISKLRFIYTFIFSRLPSVIIHIYYVLTVLILLDLFIYVVIFPRQITVKTIPSADACLLPIQTIFLPVYVYVKHNKRVKIIIYYHYLLTRSIGYNPARFRLK